MMDVLIAMIIGSAIFMMIGLFVPFTAYLYQQKRFQHKAEVLRLQEAYQKEVLKAQLEMQEQTLRNISLEIHDNIGQILSLVRLHISTMKQEDNTCSEEKILISKELLDQAIQDLRDLSKQFNAEFVSRQLLSELLQFQLKMIQKTGLLDTRFEQHGNERSMNPEKKLIIYRIVQELLNNVMKHARADAVAVSLTWYPEALLLCIEDNGKGFKVRGKPGKGIAESGLGIKTMQHRATLIGATLTIDSAPGKGTRARLLLTNNK